ncbi:unnamed protein product [Linum tenue]|uniref:Cytochrome P450 n=1 Tax=Linum tenue TaxID=586396 RepID=A0AAV0LY28_9ROSI|nr:unnamed protein product [Linum tenue]
MAAKPAQSLVSPATFTFPINLQNPTPMPFFHRQNKTKITRLQSKPDPEPTRPLPPGPLKLPVIGNLHNLALSGELPHRALRSLAAVDGPLMHLQLGEVPALVVSSPRFAHEVFKTHDQVFGQRPELLTTKIISYDNTDLAFSEGDYWRQMRRICKTEMLGPRRVRSFSVIRDDEARKLVVSVGSDPGSRSGSGLDLTRRIYAMTSNVVARAAFGDECEDQERVIEIAERSLALAGGFDLVDLFPSAGFLQGLTGMRRKLEALRQQLDMVLDKIIDEHRLKLAAEDGGREDTTAAEEETLVDVLLKIQQGEELECPITIDNVKAVLWDMFVAVTDTSSTTTEWAMSEMIRNPPTMEKAQAEVRRVFAGRSRGITEEDLQQLTYLKQVIKETMRLHPPLPLLAPRRSNAGCEIDGYHIPAGTNVLVNAWAIGRDPEYWDEADEFLPERFAAAAAGGSIDYKGGANFEYIPFGGGRRICPGMSFGLANVELPLAQLLCHFDWEIPGGIPPEDLDMTETFGGVVGRKNHLYLIATPYAGGKGDS